MMMQVNEIQQRFNQIERSIGKATTACQADTTIPAELKNCVSQLDQQAEQVRQALQAQDEASIRQYVDSLEQLGDQAEKALKRAGNVNNQIKNVVRQVHSELSDLKHQLH
jgi:hypothetical protein